MILFEHYHCPLDCEHPQPFKGDDGRVYCGRCRFVHERLTECILCTPATCKDD